MMPETDTQPRHVTDTCSPTASQPHTDAKLRCCEKTLVMQNSTLHSTSCIYDNSLPIQNRNVYKHNVYNLNVYKPKPACYILLIAPQTFQSTFYSPQRNILSIVSNGKNLEKFSTLKLFFTSLYQHVTSQKCSLIVLCTNNTSYYRFTKYPLPFTMATPWPHLILILIWSSPGTSLQVYSCDATKLHNLAGTSNPYSLLDVDNFDGRGYSVFVAGSVAYLTKCAPAEAVLPPTQSVQTKFQSG